MHEDTPKFRTYRTIVCLLAFIVGFEIVLLARAIPVHTTFIDLTLGALGFLCLYLIVLCLRLIGELQKNSRDKS